MRMARPFLLLSLVILCWQPFALRAPAATGFVSEELRIPVPGAGDTGLEAMLVKPATDGRLPLVIVSHGSPRSASERPGMTPQQMYPQLIEFARRGFVAVTVMRRGYGTSPGGWAEGLGPCQRPGYLAAGVAGAADLRAAIAYLSTRRDVDPKRVLGVGVSAGGYATVALTVDPPPGLVAAVSFAGGRGSESPDSVCNGDELVAAFSTYGAKSRTPMLWIYAENDHFFGPALAERFRNAFVSAGGNVSFVNVAAFGQDGHSLFSAAGESIWEPIVDSFLRAQGLTSMTGVLPAPPLPDFPAPAGLRANGQQAFRSYLASAPHKAFAMSGNGAFGWRTARRSDAEAKAGALSLCGAGGGKADCHVVMINDEPALK